MLVQEVQPDFLRPDPGNVVAPRPVVRFRRMDEIVILLEDDALVSAAARLWCSSTMIVSPRISGIRRHVHVPPKPGPRRTGNVIPG
jgi:hypothetical protein